MMSWSLKRLARGTDVQTTLMEVSLQSSWSRGLQDILQEKDKKLCIVCILLMIDTQMTQLKQRVRHTLRKGWDP